MRAVRRTARGVEVVDVDAPRGDGVAVQVRSAAICGSDLHMLALGPLPVTLGHEMAGVLDDGTAVAVDPSGPCGTCDQCRAGRTQLCRTGTERMLGVGADGGMAEAVRVDPAALVPLPAGVPVADACLVEPLAVAVHGLRLVDVPAGARVAVVGGGGIGLTAVAAARAAGCDVGLVARHPHQRRAGERLGARPAAGEHDVVVEAAGTEEALARAAELARPGGTVLFLSTHWSPVTIPGIPALMKELTFRWSYTYGAHAGVRDLDAAAALLARDRDIAATIVTHRFPLEDAPEAFRVAADRAAGAIKVVLEP